MHFFSQNVVLQGLFGVQQARIAQLTVYPLDTGALASTAIMKMNRVHVSWVSVLEMHATLVGVVGVGAGL